MPAPWGPASVSQVRNWAGEVRLAAQASVLWGLCSEPFLLPLSGIHTSWYPA